MSAGITFGADDDNGVRYPFLETAYEAWPSSQEAFAFAVEQAGCTVIELTQHLKELGVAYDFRCIIGSDVLVAGCTVDLGDENGEWAVPGINMNYKMPVQVVAYQATLTDDMSRPLGRESQGS